MRWILIVAFILGIAAGGFLYVQRRSDGQTLSPLGKRIEKPLENYTIEQLSRREFVGSRIVFDDAVATTSWYTVYLFHFVSDGKKVTGLAHVPRDASETNKKPVIVQLRGYVDKETYTPGEGTRRSAEVFARNGFISLASDSLGYGGSDMPSSDVFEERFQTYTTTLNLLASIPTLPMADADRVGLWGHSNGGQIALTVLEILGERGRRYPTTLWAPVTKPFPYAILYYTDEAEDHGKALRKRLAEFEREYDVERYSLPNYVDRIRAPLQLHQGGLDESVPKAWSDEFVARLKEKLKDITYFTYPNADHNMLPSWSTVVSRDIEFFRRALY